MPSSSVALLASSTCSRSYSSAAKYPNDRAQQQLAAYKSSVFNRDPERGLKGLEEAENYDLKFEQNPWWVAAETQAQITGPFGHVLSNHQAP